MPNRILREGILTSRRVNKLSERAELFYRRLMSRLDDYGRCEADAQLLRSSCYPLRVDKVKATQIEGWIKECKEAGLIVTYHNAGKIYLQYIDWNQQTRSKSRFPAPAAQMISDAKQMIADAHLDVVVVGDVFEDVDETAKRDKSVLHGGVVNGKVIETIPLADGSEWGVTETFLAELERAYPAVDGPATLKEIRVWCLSNPGRCKTKTGVSRFINRWFERTQNA